jgi:hypothetical protein
MIFEIQARVMLKLPLFAKFDPTSLLPISPNRPRDHSQQDKKVSRTKYCCRRLFGELAMQPKFGFHHSGENRRNNVPVISAPSPCSPWMSFFEKKENFEFHNHLLHKSESQMTARRV